MIVKSATEPGDPNTPNEDWVYASEELLIVIDGATARTETGCVHGVAWYAEQLGLAFAARAANHSLSLTEALAEAIAHVASSHSDCDLAHPATPSAAVGAIRFVEDAVETLALADVTIAAMRPDGTVHTITDDRVVGSARPQRSAALVLPIGRPYRDQALREMKLAQQVSRNRSGGFFVAAADPAIAVHSVTARIAADEVVSIAVLSDGAARAVDTFESMTWASLLHELNEIGPMAIIKSVRADEAADSNAQRWPRSKASDDASVAFLSIVPIGC